MDSYPEEDRKKCLDWLLNACQTWLLAAKQKQDDSSDKSKKDTFPPSELNWEILTKMAYFHGLEPILFDLTRQNILSKENIPQKTIADWERTYFSNVIKNTGFVDLLTNIVSASENENAPIIALKGMASTALLYRDLGLRSMADIDILCRQKNLTTLARILHDLGFQKRGHLQAHHLAFSHQELGIMVELHFAPQFIAKHKRKLMDLFWEHRHWAEIDDTKIPILSLEDQLTFEMAHILDHVYLVSLKHYLDFAGWLTLFKGEINWASLRYLLTESGMFDDFDSIAHSLSDLFRIPLEIPVSADFSIKNSEKAKSTIFSALLTHGFIDMPKTGTRIKSYSATIQKIGFTRLKLFPHPNVIRAAYNRSSLLTSLLSYPYHICKILSEFRSRKRREKQ